MRSIWHQTRSLRHRTSAIPKVSLQNRTHCHIQWTNLRHPESLLAEFSDAGRAWLCPTLLVRAYGGSEHGNAERLSPGMRRKLSVELVGERAALAETGAWTELLCVYVRDLLSHEVDARGDGTDTLHQNTTQKADTAKDRRLRCPAGCWRSHPSPRARPEILAPLCVCSALCPATTIRGDGLCRMLPAWKPHCVRRGAAHCTGLRD